jgi:hypothetical protein
LALAATAATADSQSAVTAELAG